MKKIAFTLAEVLVTLGILGVVSAVTMPTLIQGHQKTVYVSQLKKVYSDMNQVFLRYKTDRNALNLREAGNLNSKDKLLDFFNKYMNVVSTCTSNCFDYDFKTINGRKKTFTFDRNVVLSSGAIIWFDYMGSDNIFVSLLVDVNGDKNPNTMGRDVWALSIDNDGKMDDFMFQFYNTLKDAGANLDGYTNVSDTELREKIFAGNCSGDGTGCFNKILLDNWKMNY